MPSSLEMFRLSRFGTLPSGIVLVFHAIPSILAILPPLICVFLEGGMRAREYSLKLFRLCGFMSFSLLEEDLLSTVVLPRVL